MALLAVTQSELVTLRNAIYALLRDHNDKKEQATDALTIINAIVDKRVEVVPKAEFEDYQDKLAGLLEDVSDKAEKLIDGVAE